MSTTFLDNDAVAWSIALCIGVAVALLLYMARRLIVRRLEKFASSTETYLDDLAIKVVSATNPLFIIFMGVAAGSRWLVLPEQHAVLLSRLAIAAVLLQVAR